MIVEQYQGSERTYIVISLGGNNASGVQAGLDVELLLHLLDAAGHLEGEKGAGEATSVAEDADALALCLVVGDVCDQAGQAAVDTAAVHVTALGRYLDAGLHLGGEPLLCQPHECLLNSLVRNGCGVVEVFEFSGNVGEDGVGRVGKVIIVEQACVRLGYELAGRCVEAHVVESVQRCLLLL